MNMKTLFAAACIALTSATASFAASVTLDFPSYDSQTRYGDLRLGGGGAYWRAGDFLTESFLGTGLGSAVSSTWTFSMSNELNSNGTAPAMFDVLINGIVVDQFSFLPDRGTIEQISLSNTFSTITGDDFVLSIVATSTVGSGAGSWNWIAGGSVTLSDGMSAVPVPASLPLLLAAVGGFGIISRRRRNAA